MLAPFAVNRNWYEEAWLTNRPARSTAWKVSVIAARVIGFAGILALGLRGLGHH